MPAREPAQPTGHGAGHSVLAVPVPALDACVRERTAHYDRSFVSDDPGFVHAHITVLAPWLRDPTPDDLRTVAEVAASTRAFAVELAELGVFPDGVIHLRPRPEEALRRLTTRLAEAFPQCPPYGGRYDDVAAHLTLDRLSPTVTVESVRALVAHALPATCVVDRIDLQWWANHDCRLLGSFELGR